MDAMVTFDDRKAARSIRNETRGTRAIGQLSAGSSGGLNQRVGVRRHFRTPSPLSHDLSMATASLGRRLGDWLGIVPEDDNLEWSATITSDGRYCPDDVVLYDWAVSDEELCTGREPERDEPGGRSARSARATSAQQLPRVWHIEPTCELDAEIGALHETLNELRAGLDTDDSNSYGADGRISSWHRCVGLPPIVMPEGSPRRGGSGTTV